MRAFLLDVNVLIALVDPVHVHHDLAHRWFHSTGKGSWATCPMTENAVLRIMGDRHYPNSPGTPAVVAEVLEELVALPGHTFWADDVTMLDKTRFDKTRLLQCGQITDNYLLALACSRNGQLATLDRRLTGDAVRGGREALHLIL